MLRERSSLEFSRMQRDSFLLITLQMAAEKANLFGLIERKKTKRDKKPVNVGISIFFTLATMVTRELSLINGLLRQ